MTVRPALNFNVPSVEIKHKISSKLDNETMKMLSSYFRYIGDFIENDYAFVICGKLSDDVLMRGGKHKYISYFEHRSNGDYIRLNLVKPNEGQMWEPWSRNNIT